MIVTPRERHAGPDNDHYLRDAEQAALLTLSP